MYLYLRLFAQFHERPTQGAGVEPSLVRNGKLGTRRALSGSDDGLFGADWAPTAVEIENARARAAPPTVGREGFALVAHDTGLSESDFRDEATIVTKYYPQVSSLLKGYPCTLKIHL